MIPSKIFGCTPSVLGTSIALLCVPTFLSPNLSGAERDMIQGMPFAQRSGPRGATMFTVLPADKTGVTSENRYADPKMWSELYSEFAYGSLGTGVTIGDFDGDGRPDLFVVNKSDPCRLYRNLGDFRFEDVTDKAGLKDPNDAWKQGATFVDINNDGRLDIYICRFNAPNLLFINQGDGTFIEKAKEVGLALTDASVMASFCDYDRDGALDVYITTNLLDQQARPQGQKDHLFHNHGDGTFAEVTKEAGIYGEKQSHSATWWDFNNDGWPDLYVANDFNAPDQMYRNNGDGTFTDLLSKTAPHVPYFSMGADLADVNNDGLVDFFVADMLPRTREKNLRSIQNTRAFIARDLASPDAAPQYMQNALLLNTGTSRLAEAARLAGLAASDWTWSVRFEDLDEDGRVDLHVTNGTVRDFFDSDLNVKKALVAPEEADRMVKGTAPLREKHLAFRNLGDLRFEEVGSTWGLDQEGISFGAAFGDLDGDGDLDLVYINYQGQPTICRNDTSGEHHVIVELRGTRSNHFGIGAEVRLQTAKGKQVRVVSGARGYLSSSEPIAHFGLGSVTTIEELRIIWPSGHEQVFKNLSADQRYTITEPSIVPPDRKPAQRESSPLPSAQFEEVSQASGLSFASRESSFDELSAQRLLPFRHQAFGPGVAVGDVDGDGSDDVLIGAAAGGAAQLFLNQGTGQFQQSSNGLLSAKQSVAEANPLIADFNGDGNADILLLKGGVNLPPGSAGYQPRLLLGRGVGAFEEAPSETLPDLPISAGPAVAADFDKDGKLDLFIGGRIVPNAYPTAPRSALLANRGGKFVDVTSEMAPALAGIGMVTAALWSDVDQDGWLDLIVALEWGGVRVWRNIEGKHFEEATERLRFTTAGTGFWSSLTAGDFNGDGRVDYVLGNAGLNTRYQATSASPAIILYGDFDGSGRSTLVEAEKDGEKLLPLRGRNQLGSAFPSLIRKNPSFTAYSTMTLDELFPQERLDAAAHFSVNEVQSGLLLSQADGTFQFTPLPRIAQIAPIYGAVVGDFNGDGRLDVYVVQNSYAPIPETGRFDGGLSQLLLGNGRGEFSPISPRESGLVVSADAKGLAETDLDGDGWADFVVTRNNNVGLVFHNRGVSGNHGTRVVLHAKSGAAATGSRATLTYEDDSSVTLELYAGSGYISQSAGDLFFGYSEMNKPKELRVSWPDGSKSIHPWTGAGSSWTITEP